jgi:hypothetical protein
MADKGRRMVIWNVTTDWGVFSAPEPAVRIYSKRAKRRLFGWSVQVGESANPAVILWPHGDSIWLPFFAIDRIERATIYV